MNDNNGIEHFSTQYHRCGALWTNDDRLTQASHGLARNILK
jgi:hypothetical protein